MENQTWVLTQFLHRKHKTQNNEGIGKIGFGVLDKAFYKKWTSVQNFIFTSYLVFMSSWSFDGIFTPLAASGE